MSVATAARPIAATSSPSLAEVYRRHKADIGRWAARLGGPRVDVDDVVQEVFIVINRQLPQFRGDAKLTTWLFRITERVVRNHRRWWGVRRIMTHLSLRERDELATPGPGPGDELERREAVAAAYRVIDQLPEKYRRVLILSELEEMPPEAIAILLEARLQTVRVWLHRARRMFLDKVGDDDAETGKEPEAS